MSAVATAPAPIVDCPEVVDLPVAKADVKVPQVSMDGLRALERLNEMFDRQTLSADEASTKATA